MNFSSAETILQFEFKIRNVRTRLVDARQERLVGLCDKIIQNLKTSLDGQPNVESLRELQGLFDAQTEDLDKEISTTSLEGLTPLTRGLHKRLKDIYDVL